MINRIMEALQKRMRESTGRLCDGIQITMKLDGNVLTLIPCWDDMSKEPADKSRMVLADADWILVSGEGPAVMMGGKPQSVCRQLAEYEELSKTFWTEREQLRAYYEDHKNDDYGDSYGWYSDWHKELFGFRPSGWTYGVPRCA